MLKGRACLPNVHLNKIKKLGPFRLPLAMGRQWYISYTLSPILLLHTRPTGTIFGNNTRDHGPVLSMATCVSEDYWSDQPRLMSRTDGQTHRHTVGQWFVAERVSWRNNKSISTILFITFHYLVLLNGFDVLLCHNFIILLRAFVRTYMCMLIETC